MNNKNYYNSIDTNIIDNESPQNMVSNTWIWINKKWVYCLTFFSEKVLPIFIIIFMLLVAILSIYIIIISIGLLSVLFYFLFENTMVYIIGRASYSKNFPVCSTENYIGNNCYTTKSTYCS